MLNSLNGSKIIAEKFGGYCVFPLSLQRVFNPIASFFNSYYYGNNKHHRTAQILNCIDE